MYIPYIIERTSRGERSYDIYSRFLEDRTAMLNGEINDDMASPIMAQSLLLEAGDPQEDIYLCIGSSGGAITSSSNIYGTMNYIKPDICTICTGQAASMGAFLLSYGAKRKRFALPNSRIMIHQPSGGARGQTTDTEIQAKEILGLETVLNEILAQNTNQKIAKITKGTERDFFINTVEARKYGPIDRTLEKSFK